MMNWLSYLFPPPLPECTQDLYPMVEHVNNQHKEQRERDRRYVFGATKQPGSTHTWCNDEVATLVYGDTP